MFYIARLNDDGTWNGIRSTTDSDYADQLCEFYCEKYPSAYIDVLTYEEMHDLRLQEQMMIR